MNLHEHIVSSCISPSQPLYTVIKEWFNAWELGAEIHEAVERLAKQQHAASNLKSKPRMNGGVAAFGSCVKSEGSSKH